MLGIEPMASCMLGEHSTHSATPLASTVSFVSCARKYGRPWAEMHMANGSLNDGLTSVTVAAQALYRAQGDFLPI